VPEPLVPHSGGKTNSHSAATPAGASLEKGTFSDGVRTFTVRASAVPAPDSFQVHLAGQSREVVLVISGLSTRDLRATFEDAAKDRAEHVMLVDLARNDVNRVCDPTTVHVDRLMKVDKFSHVQHLTSEVSGVLRPGQTRWDAFRSIFPAGTVSGAPKIRAVQLISGLEQEKRGPYSGAVGWFAFDQVRDGTLIEGPVDTCIAIRTMLVREGIAYLQAGGGFVFDSDEFDEWMETMNKLGANLRCIELAERQFEGRVSAKTVKDIINELKGDN
jgi:anthranilate synthase component 1